MPGCCAAYPLGDVPLTAVMCRAQRTPPASPLTLCDGRPSPQSPTVSWVSAESLDSIISLANKSEEQMELDGLIYRLCHSLYCVAKNKSAKMHQLPVDDECSAFLGDDSGRFRNMRGHKDWCPLRHLFEPSSYYRATRGSSNPHVGCSCLGGSVWSNDPASASQWLANELSVTRLSGGNTNHVYRLCHVSYPGRALLLRVYGDGGGGVIDRARDVKAMKQMSGVGMSPAVLHSFHWGRVEEFMGGAYTCTTEMLLASPSLLADIYEGLCRMHQLDAVPFLPGNVDDGKKLLTDQLLLFDADEMAAILEKCGEYYTSMACEKVLESLSPTSFERACFRLLRLMWLNVKEAYRPLLIDWLAGEVVFVSSEMRRRSSPVVFSHNDLNPGNILLSRRKVPAALREGGCDCCPVGGDKTAAARSSGANDKANSLVERCGYLFIDYEYADANYRCFDMGNTLCELDYDYTQGTEAGGRGFIKFLFTFPPAAKAEAWRGLGEEYPRMPELILDAWRRGKACGGEPSDIGAAALLALLRYFATREGAATGDAWLSEAQVGEVLVGMLASHLHWTLWAIVMGCVPDECGDCAGDDGADAGAFAVGGSGLDYMRYGECRLREYIALRSWLVSNGVL